MKRSMMQAGAAWVTTAVSTLNLIGITPALAQSISEPAITQSSSSSFGASSSYYHGVSSMTSLTTQQKIDKRYLTGV